MTDLREKHIYDAGRSWTIYRVPKNLCGVQKKAFVPKIISVGPFHYHERKDRLQVMEEHKMRFLMNLPVGRFEQQKSSGDTLATTEGESESDFLNDLVEAMKPLEEKARACYSESFADIGGDEFVEMMVMDGCFVVELLRLYYQHVVTKSPVDDPIFTTPWMLRTLQRDLLMLENQLPLIVLEKLFRLINKNRNIERPAVSLETLAVTFFNPLFPREDAVSKLDTERTYDHLLDAFRSTFLKSVRGKLDENGWAVKSQLNPGGSTSTHGKERQLRQLKHFVSELQEVGVRFKKRAGEDLLDIIFDGGRTLQVPPLSIDDNAVPLFLNFVAYEQCHDHAKPFFTNYFMFWDSLVNSPVDIEILHKDGIIDHVLGSDVKVQNLLNNVCREIVYDIDQSYLYNQIKGLNDYCKPYDENKYRKWWRNLIRQYFNSPWTCLSLLAAIILLLLTILQTGYTVYPYYRPN